MTVVLEARGLGKRYRLGEGGYATLRERLDPRSRSRASAADTTREIWALRDLDLQIDEGDAVGIIGRNGVGKTTFLKTVARIVRPTTGFVRVRGRVGALLEVGTGFHPELTGRENVYLNGVVLGMTRREVKARFDAIVEFAGVERFLDTPLKRYSSGMYLRLAFAVAAHVDPDVLIVDEVLAVGDAEFQRRCLGRMSEFGREGRTVLFVSHDSGAVARLCSRAVWLKDGRIEDDGPAVAVLDRYLGSVIRHAPEVSLPVVPGSPVADVSVAVLDELGAPADVLRRDQPLTLRLGLTVTESVYGLDASLYLTERGGARVINENVSDGPAAGALAGDPGGREVVLRLPALLAAGRYVVGTWVGTPHRTFVSAEAYELTLLPLPGDQSTAKHGLVRPAADWDVRVSPRREPAG